MHITAFAQKKQVIIYILTVVVIIMGIFSFFKMPLMLLPQIKIPGAIVQTTMVGAPASQIDHEISKPLLGQLNTLPNLKVLSSSAYPSISLIEVDFKINTPPIAALQNIQEKVDQARPTLPHSANAPQIVPLNYTNLPIMTLALQSQNKTRLALTNFAKASLLRDLLHIPGVLNATLSGDREEALLVDLDPNKMTAYRVNIQDIGNAFKSENVSFPGYFVDTQNKGLLLNLNEQFTTITQVQNLIVSEHQGKIVRLKQIADIHYGPERSISAVQFNGRPAIGISISRQSNENSVAVINRIKKYLKTEAKQILPKGTTLTIAHDNAKTIISNVESLEMTVIYAIVFACIVVYLFIRSFRSMIIIFVAIPISILFSIIMLHVLGHSFNILTLLSIVLLVGLVVDDAIVVTENIHRVRLQHPELSASEGTLRGTKQVTFAVLASTLSLLVIFASSLVMTGSIGTLFSDFSIAILFGVAMSYFVSMTLTPLLAQHFMVIEKTESRFYRALRKVEAQYVALYNWSLHGILRFRYITIVLIICALAPVFYVLPKMGHSLFARHDNHSALHAEILAPPSANLSYMLKMSKKVNQLIEENPNVKNTYMTVGPLLANKAAMRINLKPYNETHQNSNKIMAALSRTLKTLPGVFIKLRPVPISSNFSEPLNFAVTDKNYNTLIAEAKNFIIALYNRGIFGDVSTDLEPEQPQYKLVINRNLANSRGITAEMIMSSAALFGGHIHVGALTPRTGTDQTYNIYLEPKKGTLITPDDLNKIYLFAKGNEFVQLSTVATLKKMLLPAKVSRIHRLFAVTFSSTPNIATNHALNIVYHMGEKYLSPTSHIVPIGETASSHQAIQSTLRGLIFAFIILYIVMAIQFNSFVQPIIVLVTQPLALVGAIYVLYWADFALSIFSLIGILLLMGLVAKNAILLVNRTNQYRAKGLDIRTALKKACPERLVPITMTSLTIILAMIPVLLQTGVGVKNQIVLATTIVSGIVSSTFLSVILVPALYDVIETAQARFMSLFKRGGAA